MRIAALVEHVPGPDGPEMAPLARRAVAQGIELAAAVGDGTCTAIAVGARDVESLLREAIACGRTCSTMTDGVLVHDPDAAGRDQADAAALLAETVELLGPFDLVLVGAGTLGDDVASKLGLPYAAAARFLGVQRQTLHVRCERDDGWLQVKLEIPATVSCAADLIDPCEASATARALIADDLVRVLSIDDVRAR